MIDQYDNKRENLLSLLLIALEFQVKNSPWPDIYKGSEERYRESYAKSTSKRFLKGLEEAARDTIQIAAEWPREDRADFYQRVRDSTGRSFFAIAGNIERSVEKILKRNKVGNEDDLQLLLDYVSDYPCGKYFESCQEFLRAQGQ